MSLGDAHSEQDDYFRARVLPELERGVSAADLHDLGVPPDGVLTIEDVDIDGLSSEASVPGAWDPTERNRHLSKFFEHVSAWRRLVGFTDNPEHRPSHPDAARLERDIERASAEAWLKKACGDCALRLSGCPLANSLELWIDRHPYSDKGVPPDTEGRKQFKRRLDRDPKASCVPEVDLELLEVVSHHPASVGLQYVDGFGPTIVGAREDMSDDGDASPPSPELLARVRELNALTKRRLMGEAGLDS